ncbi:unnamed protein product, partial [marine sediment metagenome]
LSSFDESSLYDTLNIRDAEVSGRFKVRVKEQWTGSSEAWSSYSSTYYHANAARQIGDRFGKNMLEHIMRDIETDEIILNYIKHANNPVFEPPQVGAETIWDRGFVNSPMFCLNKDGTIYKDDDGYAYMEHTPHHRHPQRHKQL